MARPRESDRRPLLDLGLGYWRSKAFLTACNLKLFTLVSQGFDTVEKVCVSEGLSQRGTRILMDAMASLRLLKKQGHGYRVASEVTGLLVEGSPEYLGDFFTAVDSMFFSPFGRFEEAVRTGKAVWNVDEAGRHIPISPEEGRLLARAMYGLSLPAARALSASHDLSGRSHLLDIGGGAGAMAIEMASKNPGLKATVLDRPTVCEVSRKYIDKAGLSSRVAAKDSDFFRDPLPAGADVHLYSNILHNFGDEECRGLLKKSFESLTPGGEVLVVDYVLNEDGVSPPFSSLVNLFALVAMPQGGTRPYSVLREWLREAGFVKVQRRRLSGPTALIKALKSG